MDILCETCNFYGVTIFYGTSHQLLSLYSDREPDILLPQICQNVKVLQGTPFTRVGHSSSSERATNSKCTPATGLHLCMQWLKNQLFKVELNFFNFHALTLTLYWNYLFLKKLIYFSLLMTSVIMYFMLSRFLSVLVFVNQPPKFNRTKSKAILYM